MNVTKKSNRVVAKEGEILGITVQVGTKEKNAKAPVFADKYKKVVFGYFFVKEIDEDKIMTLMNLKTKKELVIKNSNWRGTPACLFEAIYDEIVKRTEDMEIRTWGRNLDYSKDPSRTSATISIYPSFAVTSLGHSTMNENGTFTFSLEDVEGICLDKVAVYKQKFMLHDYYRI